MNTKIPLIPSDLKSAFVRGSGVTATGSTGSGTTIIKETDNSFSFDEYLSQLSATFNKNFGPLYEFNLKNAESIPKYRRLFDIDSKSFANKNNFEKNENEYYNNQAKLAGMIQEYMRSNPAQTKGWSREDRDIDKSKRLGALLVNEERSSLVGARKSPAVSEMVFDSLVNRVLNNSGSITDNYTLEKVNGEYIDSKTDSNEYQKITLAEILGNQLVKHNGTGNGKINLDIPITGSTKTVAQILQEGKNNPIFGVNKAGETKAQKNARVKNYQKAVKKAIGLLKRADKTNALTATQTNILSSVRSKVQKQYLTGGDYPHATLTNMISSELGIARDQLGSINYTVKANRAKATKMNPGEGFIAAATGSTAAIGLGVGTYLYGMAGYAASSWVFSTLVTGAATTAANTGLLAGLGVAGTALGGAAAIATGGIFLVGAIAIGAYLFRSVKASATDTGDHNGWINWFGQGFKTIIAGE